MKKKVVHPVHPHPKTHPVKKTKNLEIVTQEFHRYDKNQFWYIGIGLLLASALLIAWRQHDYILALLVIAAGIAIFRLSDLRPGHRTVTFSSTGLHWGNHFLAYHQLRSFYLANRDDQLNLYIERLNLLPPLHLALPDAQAEPTVTFLLGYLPYHEHKGEPLADRLARFLRL